jgi:uncharacterized DUF497 family protein
MVWITFDRTKRDKTLKERGLDFRRAREVFATIHLTRPDDRREYGEQRFITAGRLDESNGRHRLDTSRSCPTRYLDEEG